MSSNDTEHEALANLIDKKLDGDAGYGVGAFLAGVILTEFLPGHDERVKAEAWREGHDQALHNVAWPKESQGNPYDRRAS